MNPVYGYNYGYVQSNFNQPYYYQLPSYVPLQDTPNLVFEEKKPSKREKQAKKQRLLSGQNDSFTRSDISTETTSTNTSYSNKRANSRKNPKNKTLSRSSISSTDDFETAATPLAQLNEMLQGRTSSCAVIFEESGVQLMPPFTVVCYIESLNLRAEARGSSKKDAKHKAAAEMVELVRSLSGLNGRPKIDLRQVSIDSIANPIGLAQYFTQLHKNPPPVYRFQPTSQPPFKCVAELGDGRSVEGIAHRRTDAKSGAARLLLKLLKNDQVKMSCDQSSQSSENDHAHPVAMLQEFCHENQIYLPKYYYNQLTKGNETSHTCKCTLLHLVTTETRKSQREARRAAAAIMYQLVQKLAFKPPPQRPTQLNIPIGGGDGTNHVVT